MNYTTRPFDDDGSHPSPPGAAGEAQQAVDKFAAQLKHGLLERLFYREDPAAEPICDICRKPITREQFPYSAVTLNWGTRRWRITHNACESGADCAYWVGLDVLGTPKSALGHTFDMMGHRGFPHWKTDVIDRLYPVKQTTAPSAKAS
jgi:hypothetical protein